MDFVEQVAKCARMRRTGAAAWGVIILLFALSLSVRVVFAKQMDTVPFAAFLPAVLIATFISGWRRSLTLLTASVVTTWLLVGREPEGLPLTPSFDVRVPAFLILSGILMVLIETLAQAVERLESTAQLNAELFRELQHRVANNFQIVAATLQKARRGIADKVALDAVDHAVFRINALAQMHRRLYDPASYANGLEPILRDVLAETFHAVAVEVRIDVAAESLSVGKMTTIVLLVNEAAINAAKHVFRPQYGEKFVVSLRVRGSENVLTVSDDGPGFKSPETNSVPRYGLAVMRGLAVQLGGTLETLDGPGATIRVAFG